MKRGMEVLEDAFDHLKISRLNASAFTKREAWSAFEDRDLGLAAATDGRIGAFHMRALGPCEGAQGWHYHRLEFHMVFILRGSVTYMWSGHKDPVVVEAGGCLVQPPGGPHNVIDYTSDLEVLEITMPAAYETMSVEEPS